MFYVSAAKILIPEKHYNLDIEQLHRIQKENPNIDTYLHTTRLFNLIHSGLRSDNIVTTVNNIGESSKFNYNELSQRALHNTTTTITLLDGKNYFSLDDDFISKNIESITPDYIIDCNKKDIKIGDYYIGTSSSTHKDVSTQANHKGKKGFVFCRQVTSVRKNTKNKCKRVITRIVHPMQIANIRTETNITFPYDRIQASRELIEQSAFMTPDLPLLLCTDKKVVSKRGAINKAGSGKTTLRGIPIDYSYQLDLKGNECLYATATIPGSINFNRGSGTNAIKRDIALSNGITCTNCYAFMGAGVLAILNIFGGDLSTFSFEAKTGGGMGFKLDLLLTNPSFSASKYINLAGPGPKSSIPIAYGLSLDVNFGGAWATIKGSGNAKGQASFSSGYTILEEDYIMYSRSKWSSKHSFINSNELTPKYVNKGITFASTSLSAIVAISTRIQFSFGGSVPVIGIGAHIDFSTVLTATAQYVKWAASYSYSLSFDEERYLRVTTNGIENYETHQPGDIITFKLNYEGLNAREPHELYFNIHMPKHGNKTIDNGSGYPIKMHKFKSSPSGRGSLNVDWKIPNDFKFFQQDNKNSGIVFSVHSSARMERAFTKKQFKIMQKRDPRQQTFTYPKKGDLVPIGENVKITWDKYSIGGFKYIKGTDGMGREEHSPKVGLILVSEETKKAYDLAENIANSGVYYAKFPKTLLKNGDHYFVVIYDSNEYSKIAWNKGSFKLVNPPNIRGNHDRTMHEELLLTNVEPPILDLGLPLWNNTNISQNTISKYNMHNSSVSWVQTSKNDGRKLAGPSKCPKSAISVLLQVEFGFDGITILDKRLPIGSTSSSPFTIIPQTNFCV
jgi:hypothetical protein